MRIDPTLRRDIQHSRQMLPKIPERPLKSSDRPIFHPPSSPLSLSSLQLRFMILDGLLIFRDFYIYFFLAFALRQFSSRSVSFSFFLFLNQSFLSLCELELTNWLLETKMRVGILILLYFKTSVFRSRACEVRVNQSELGDNSDRLSIFPRVVVQLAGPHNS